MVGRTTAKGENVFQTRLNELFAASNRRLTNAVVVAGLLAHGCRISEPYLSQLRNGDRANPSDEVIGALSAYFGVSPGFFFTIPWNGDRHLAQAADGAVIAQLDDHELRQLLLIASGLSATSLELLLNLAAKLRISDHLRKVHADSPGYARLTEVAVEPRSTTSPPQPRPVGPRDSTWEFTETHRR